MTTFVKLYQISRLIHDNQCRPSDINPGSNDSRSSKIISFVKTKNGLNEYCSHHFQNDDVDIIDDMYNYAYSQHSQYFHGISMASKQNGFSGKYQIKFWNVQDLVINTFGYLQFKDLCSCSNVNSILLHLASNPLALEYVEFRNPKTVHHLKNNSRFAKRLIKVKHFSIRSFSHSSCSQSYIFTKQIQSLMNNTSMTRLLILQIDIKTCHVCSFFRSIQSYHQNLQAIQLEIRGYRDECKLDEDSCLYLPNARYVHISEQLVYPERLPAIQFPVLLSDKCEYIHLNKLHWENIQSVSNSKHLSNLRSLSLENISNTTGVSMQTIYKAVLLFQSIKYLDLHHTIDMMTFWRAMKSVIKSNQTKVRIYNRDGDKPSLQLLTDIHHYWFGHCGLFANAAKDPNERRLYSVALKQLLYKTSHTMESFIGQIWFSVDHIFNLNLKMPNLKCLEVQLVQKSSFDEVINMLKFMNKQQEYQPCACLFCADIDVSQITSPVVEYYLKLLLQMVAMWIQDCSPVRMKLRFQGASAFTQTKKCFTKFVQSLSPLKNQRIKPEKEFIHNYCTLLKHPVICFKTDSNSTQDEWNLDVTIASTSPNKRGLDTAMSTYWNAKIREFR